MKREFIHTEDGSMTIHLPEWDEQYHSKHGAIQEAQHVFLKNGWDFFCGKYGMNCFSDAPLRILELGFGTGLNAFLSFLKAENERIETEYTTVEAYPLSKAEIEKLNYVRLLSAEDRASVFESLHELPWGKKHGISDFFSFKKDQGKFQDISEKEKFDLVFFDAFSPRVQPELWTVDIFKKMHDALSKNGVLTTYCAKGSVRRAMQEAGFIVERLPGPPGKREMLRAIKGCGAFGVAK